MMDAIESGPDDAHNGPGFSECQKIKITKLSPKVLLEYLHNQYTTYRGRKITTMTLGCKEFKPVNQMIRGSKMPLNQPGGAFLKCVKQSWDSIYKTL
jgi:hypothetical protein